MPTNRQGDGAARIPTSLAIAIAALGLITLTVVIALFTGTGETYGAQIFVTILYFAAFAGTLIGVLAIATRAPSFPLPLAVIAAVFVMAFGTVLIWVSYSRAGYDPYDSFGSMANAWIAFWILVPLWIISIVPVLAAWGGVRLSGPHPALRAIAYTTASLFGVLAVMSFLPLVIENSFGIAVTDLYWRAVAAIWIVAIALTAVYALLRWFFWREDRAGTATPSAASGGAMPPAASYGTPHEQLASYPVIPPAPAPAVAEPLPWPFAEDGTTPLPAQPDGLPDFGVLITDDGRPQAVRAGDPEAIAAIERGRVAAGR